MPLALKRACLSVLLPSFAYLALAKEPNEGPPVFFASDVLAPELRKGEHFEVSPIVHVVNFGYQIKLESDYGTYDVWGPELLKKRIKEIEAIAKLEEIGQTEAFTRSFSEALKHPLVNTWQVARRPISTVAGIPSGIGRYLQGKFYQVKRGSEKAISRVRKKNRYKAEEEKETDATMRKKVTQTTSKLSRRHLGFNTAKRAWARRLKVDPYSKNQELQTALERIAWASSVGSFAGDYAIPSSAALGYVGRAQEIVWAKSPSQIERRIHVSLRKMGVDKETINYFQEMDFYSLSEKISIILALDEMEDVEGKLEFLTLVLGVEGSEEAFLIVKMTAILEEYHRLVMPLSELSVKKGLAVGYTEEGIMILPLALDYLHWAPLIVDALISEELAEQSRELWITGRASSIAAHRLEKHGWFLQENCFELFLSKEMDTKNLARR